MSKTVFITGTSSGFGKLMVQTLLKGNHHVIATMREPEGRNQAAAQELRGYQGGKLDILPLDVTNAQQVENAPAEALKRAKHVDVLINNAGLGTGGLTEGFTTEQVERLFQVNLFSIHRLTRAFLPHFRDQKGGQIINISSVMGRMVIPFSAVYTASKYALEGYSESLRYELQPLGIQVSLIEPGGFMTGFMNNMLAPQDEQRLAEYGDYAKAPEQMWGGVAEALTGEGAPDPQEVADAARDLVETENQIPLRVVVDPMTGGEGAKAINQTTDQVQDALLESFGMKETN